VSLGMGFFYSTKAARCGNAGYEISEIVSAIRYLLVGVQRYIL